MEVWSGNWWSEYRFYFFAHGTINIFISNDYLNKVKIVIKYYGLYNYSHSVVFYTVLSFVDDDLYINIPYENGTLTCKATLSNETEIIGSYSLNTPYDYGKFILYDKPCKSNICSIL